MLKNNPAFKEVFQHEHYRFYIPEQITEYHACRQLEANNQIIFASSGATKDVLVAHLDKMIEMCNASTPAATLKTDIAAIANALKYRTSKPVDEKCAIRLGALLCFMEYEVNGETITEDPNTVKPFWLAKKMEIADNNPDMYAFFLGWGISNIPEYRERLSTLNPEAYFQERKEVIRSLLTHSCQQLASL